MKRIPGSIVAMLATAAAVAAFGLEQKLGLETIGSKFGPGAIPLGLLPFQWPDLGTWWLVTPSRNRPQKLSEISFGSPFSACLGKSSLVRK